jgi:hypothetical protein
MLGTPLPSKLCRLLPGALHVRQIRALTAATWSAQELQEIVGFPEYFEEEARYAVAKQQ